jgi:hypothetical protein
LVICFMIKNFMEIIDKLLFPLCLILIAVS